MSVAAHDAVVNAAGERLGVGVHDITAERYHADPCPEPSLRASSIETLLEKTPADFQLEHPRLAPPADPDDEKEPRAETKEQRLGTLIHALVLGKSREITVCDFKDWKTDKAKQERADATVRGEIAVLPKELKRAEKISAVVLPKLEALFGMWPLGESEMTVVWKRETAHGPIYCRAQIDHLSDDRTLLVDLKTTGLALDDASLSKKFAGYGGAYQAAWHTSGIVALHPHLAGRVQFKSAVISVKPPFHVRKAAYPAAWLHMADRRIATAADTFARCLKHGEWPGYPDTELTLEMPGWLERKWLEEALTGEEL